VPGEGASLARLGMLTRPIAGVQPADAVARDEAFAVLYERQFGRVYAYLRYRLGDELLAEDMSAEVFARAWGKLRNLDDPDRATAWLFATARNLLADHYRGRPGCLSLSALPAGRHPATDSPEAQLLTEESLSFVSHCLTGLSEREREIVGLRFVAGLRNREIALAFGLSEGNVAKIIHRALAKVRARLREEYPDG